MDEKQAAALRKPFPKEAIGRLPKGGTWLDYVGHAATTDRLLSVDPNWTWEPFAVDERGLPRMDESGGLWIRLTVAGVSRVGYGDAGGKKGANAVKEAIGDALRNAAMRFGVALDLWAKEDLSVMHQAAANGERVDTSTGDVKPASAKVSEVPGPALVQLRDEIKRECSRLGMDFPAMGRDYSAWADAEPQVDNAMYAHATPADLRMYRDRLRTLVEAPKLNGVPS